jgi:hypothetical protein
MKTLIAFAALTLAAPVLAADEAKPAAPVAGAPDMSKMGPMARPVKNEKADQKELADFGKAYEAASKKHDLAAMVDLTDFPVVMMTDSSKGEFKMVQMSKDEWTGMMKPFVDNAPKDMKMEMGKVTCTMMSDDLAQCVGVSTLSMGKMKGKYNSAMIMTRSGGKWKVKSMMEAGWGDMPADMKGSATAPTTGGATPAATTGTPTK